MGEQRLEGLGLGWGWGGFFLKKYCSPKSAHNLGKVESLRVLQLRMRNEFGQWRPINLLSEKQKTKIQKPKRESWE